MPETDPLDVEFRSGDGVCAARLFLPESASSGGARHPAILIMRGFGQVQEAGLEEAKFFAAAGYVVLTFDYRHFGRSSGEPRGQLFPLAEVEDCRNAVSYLARCREVDPARIMAWGTSFGGAMSLYTTAVDRRIAGAIAQVPIVDGRAWLRALRGTDKWLQLLAAIQANREALYDGRSGGRIALVGGVQDDSHSAMPGDADFAEFFDEAARRLPTWRPDITLESLERVMEFRPIDFVAEIAPRPLCIVASSTVDKIHPVDQILEAFDRAREPKKMLLLPIDGMAFYALPGRDVALNEALDWLTSVGLGAEESGRESRGERELQWT